MNLQLTRRLALTENVARVEPVSWMVPTTSGDVALTEFTKRRLRHRPVPPLQADILGDMPLKDSLEIPLHPETTLNYQKPTLDGLQLLSSYARHVLRQPHPEHPEAKPVAVKIYRVLHRIVRPESLAMGGDPRDWIYYLPYYVGKYDVDGRLMDPHDPFLFWLLPILRERDNDPQSPLLRHIFKHSGDPDWVRQPPPRW
jgi:hypothetical protein